MIVPSGRGPHVGPAESTNRGDGQRPSRSHEAGNTEVGLRAVLYTTVWVACQGLREIQPLNTDEMSAARFFFID